MKLNEFYDFKRKCENTECRLKSLLESKIECKQRTNDNVENTKFQDIKEEFDIIIKSEMELSDREYTDDYTELTNGDSNTYEISKKESKENCDFEMCEELQRNILTIESNKFPRKFNRKKRKNNTIQMSKDNLRKNLKLKPNVESEAKIARSQKYLEKFKSFGDPKNKSNEKMDPKNYQCELCGCTYKTKSILKKHLLTHTSEKPFSCPLCSKQYTRSEHLVVHMRVHTGIKPYVCEMCARPFAKNQDLSRHKRIHFDEKKFQCPRCDRRFKRSADVHTHMRTHTGIRPFVCKGCDKSYTSHSGLWKHYKNNCTLGITEQKHSIT